MLTLSTGYHDGAGLRHDWFLDDIGQWLANGRVRWCVDAAAAAELQP